MERINKIVNESIVKYDEQLHTLFEDLTKDLLLLANGVILPPCKVGDTVYVPWKWNGEKGIATIEVEEIRIYDSKNHYMLFIDMESDDEDYNQTYGGWKIDDEIGKTIFLTREEAERALKGGEADA